MNTKSPNQTEDAAPPAPPKSPRRRAREFALQGLYQRRLGGHDEAAIEAHLQSSPGFDKADRDFFTTVFRGVIAQNAALQEQLEREQQGIKPVRNYGEAFRSRNVVLLCMQYFAWSIGVYGFVLWLPSIIRSGGENLGMVEVGWLSSVPYLAATIAMIVVSWASDKLQNRKLFVWPLLLIAAFAFIGSWAVGANHFWASYTLLVVAGAAMYAPYGPFFAIIPEMLPRNVAGGAMALINSMGALGSFCGSWFVGYLNGATGSPSASYIFMGVALFASVWLTLIVKPANNQQHPVGARHA